MAVVAATVFRSRTQPSLTKKLLSILPLVSSSASGFTVAPRPLVTSAPARISHKRAMSATAFQEDPYLYLEEVESPESLAFATEANEKCLAALGDPSQTDTYQRVLAALTSDDRIPHVSMMGYQDGEMILFNFWRDAKVRYDLKNGHMIMLHSGIKIKGLYLCFSLEPQRALAQNYTNFLQIQQY
jgi:hypothetical protein